MHVNVNMHDGVLMMTDMAGLRVDILSHRPLHRQTRRPLSTRHLRLSVARHSRASVRRLVGGGAGVHLYGSARLAAL